MRKIIFAILVFSASVANAQKSSEITPENFLKLQQYEDTLQFLGDSAVQSKNWEIREVACIQFLKRLVQALKIENSYLYPFDSLKTISIVKPEDDNFRIITWQLTMKDQSYRYYGTIQMNNTTLKMTPLIDMSLFIGNEQDTVLSANSWYGCIYFNIVKQRYKKQDYYLLFGWDGNDKWSNKKIVDVLTFDQFGSPMFGSPMFLLKDNPQPKTRIVVEYKEDASPNVNYDDKLEMIVISYLRPENPLSEGIYFTYIPDGTYVGFYFKKGMWHFKEKIFDQTLDAPPDNTPKREGVDPNIYQR
ncbi:MAG: hypothetical protein KBF42_02295 [Chitinophagales bacterium]|nr:hypothetical protein [Bacteroidota bacterium]MBK7568411.1 hypothetical protein [Bacteroidota bacterium]MBP8915470.1 hypothetical protein [Chitinophagales bacterium]MBP9220186.1 hypothetical protein [Chitinophagales bacterium]MBP9794656.1 hypothetical protein [Chitinophagales bacterium]